MHTDIEKTIADTAGLTPENYRRELTSLAEERQRSHDHVVRSTRALNAPTRYTRGRQVLIPGKRKAQRHPWADRLIAARSGGFVVDQTHPDTNIIVGSCFACGHRFGFVYGDEPGKAMFEAEAERHKKSPDNGWRECTDGAVL